MKFEDLFDLGIIAVAKIIEFNRPAKYELVEKLGNGACGETVRIRDVPMDAEFVAKKYKPFVSEDEDALLFKELLERFKTEARILFRLNHPNIVRVFNFFDYSEVGTSYIVMEYVSGQEILDYLRFNQENAEKVFEGVVQGFAHLQGCEVLHRDIRPANILVGNDGVPKIIDFGFGKHIPSDQDGHETKSISLNWWCEKPPEFTEGVYDFQTEVYFVGKLFQLAVQECSLNEFKYKVLLGKMCDPVREKRPKSFSEVQNQIVRGKFSELSFSASEISVYREFAFELSEVVSSIQFDAKFERDNSKVLGKLEKLHRESMLEEFLPGPNKLVQIFVMGTFSYWTNATVKVQTLLHFIELLRSLSEFKQAIVIENLIGRLEASERTQPDTSDYDNEIPF